MPKRLNAHCYVSEVGFVPKPFSHSHVHVLYVVIVPRFDFSPVFIDMHHAFTFSHLLFSLVHGAAPACEWFYWTSGSDQMRCQWEGANYLHLAQEQVT